MSGKRGPNIPWSDEEKAFVMANADCMKDEEIAALFSRLRGVVVNVPALRALRYRLGIIKEGGQGVSRVRR